MEKPPKFIKAFSKEESPEQRQHAADAIRAKRVEHFDRKRELTGQQSELQRRMSERESALAERLQSLQDLQREIDELSTSTLGKIFHYFELKKLRADLAVGQRTMEELHQQQTDASTEHEAISETLGSKESPPELAEAKQMVSDFYRDQQKKWVNGEYTKEEITELFSEAHLSSLSIEEYVLLLKRFPREMVAHVTRQGIRDHTGHMQHTAGEGAYTNGFMRMIEDGRLRSPLGVYLVEDQKEQAIARFLKLDRVESKEKALAHLDELTHPDRKGDSGSYADRMAVHFATEEVADCFYGSEKGNEIFIVYPSAHIASQYYFSGRLHEGGGGYWNDQWVWANEERGMDLNAGLVFLPAQARVDRNTGSRYALDAKGNPMKNEEGHAALRRVVDAEDFHDFAREAMEIVGKLTGRWDDPDLSFSNVTLLRRLLPFRERLAKAFGISDQRLQMALLTYDHLLRFDAQKQAQEEGRTDMATSIDQRIDEALQAEGLQFAETKDPIPSKEFWEQHFATHPGTRPSKVIYYKGTDPTRALFEWRKAQGIDKKATDKALGFSERNVMRDVPQASAGLDRFRLLAEKVIDDHFAKRESKA